MKPSLTFDPAYLECWSVRSLAGLPYGWLFDTFKKKQNKKTAIINQNWVFDFLTSMVIYQNRAFDFFENQCYQP